MDLRSSLITSGMLALVVTGIGLGWRFWRQGNILLGAEWMILGFSAFNFALWNSFGVQLSYEISMVCDAFSRSIGIPVIATLGLAKLTHGFDVSKATKWLLLVGGFPLAYGLLAYPPIQPALPYAFFACGLVATIFLVYFAIRLAQVGEYGHAIAVMVTNILFVITALLEGIIAIPGEETNLVLNFFFLAGWIWALGFAEIYFAYQALARHLAPPSSAAARSDRRPS
ncbi:hypothetical protein [Sphingopyxis sp.]|uniref:hypothetical protein n=1 Tax=Sphingopyxis sp. TaxID=1908224 RepID=UPI00311F1D6B